MLGFDKIQSSPKIPSMILNSLTEAFDKGVIGVGDEMPSERELSDMLGVSRGPIRESLAIIEFLGIIETHGNKRIIVKDFENIKRASLLIDLSGNNDLISDFVEFRKIFELFMLDLAIERATEEDVERIRKSVIDMEKDPSNFDADKDFHMAIAIASHNTFIASVEDLLLSVLRDARWRSSHRPGRKEEILEDHKAILRAIESNDSQIAKKILHNHLGSAYSYLMEDETLEGDD